MLLRRRRRSLQAQRRIDAEAHKADKAVADWNAIELELAQTKHEMLATLAAQKEARVEIIDVRCVAFALQERGSEGEGRKAGKAGTPC